VNAVLAARGIGLLVQHRVPGLAPGRDPIEEFGVALRLHPIEQRFDRRPHRADGLRTGSNPAENGARKDEAMAPPRRFLSEIGGEGGPGAAAVKRVAWNMTGADKKRKSLQERRADP
jgi:hypothetical protein